MRPYSMDLRERVLRDSDAGLLADVVAERYHVSGSWVRWLKQRRRERHAVRGEAPRGQRHDELDAGKTDDILEALGIAVSIPTICRAVQQLGLNVKKNRTAQRARPA